MEYFDSDLSPAVRGPSIICSTYSGPQLLEILAHGGGEVGPQFEQILRGFTSRIPVP
jgi:hypothetical protein